MRTPFMITGISFLALLTLSCVDGGLKKTPSLETVDLPRFNPEEVETLEGEVLSMQTFSFANRPAPQVQILLRTTKGDIAVELGPKWYIDAEGWVFEPMDTIEVTGSISKVNESTLMVASKVKKGKQKLMLRNEQGTPLWGGLRAN